MWQPLAKKNSKTPSRLWQNRSKQGNLSLQVINCVILFICFTFIWMYFLCFYFFLSLHTSLFYIIKKIEQSLKQKQNTNCLTDFTKPALVKNKKNYLRRTSKRFMWYWSLFLFYLLEIFIFTHCFWRAFTLLFGFCLCFVLLW